MDFGERERERETEEREREREREGGREKKERERKERKKERERERERERESVRARVFNGVEGKYTMQSRGKKCWKRCRQHSSTTEGDLASKPLPRQEAGQPEKSETDFLLATLNVV